MTLLLVALGTHFVSKYITYHQYTLNIQSGLSLYGNVFLISALEKKCSWKLKCELLIPIYLGQGQLGLLCYDSILDFVCSSMM